MLFAAIGLSLEIAVVPALARVMPLAFAVSGAAAYVAVEESGVLVYDLTNLPAPSLVSTVEMPARVTYNLDVDGLQLSRPAAPKDEA